MTIRIGDKVRDNITGVEGIAVARTVWINGCVRVVVQPQIVKDGKPVDTSCVDEPQLTVLQRGAVRAEPEQTPEPQQVVEPIRKAGGPRDDATATAR